VFLSSIKSLHFNHEPAVKLHLKTRAALYLQPKVQKFKGRFKGLSLQREALIF